MGGVGGGAALINKQTNEQTLVKVKKWINVNAVNRCTNEWIHPSINKSISQSINKYIFIIKNILLNSIIDRNYAHLRLILKI